METKIMHYKSHIKKNDRSCKIETYLAMNSVMRKDLYLAFVIIDAVNNLSVLTYNQIEDLLLEKEKFWISTLVAQHHGIK